MFPQKDLYLMFVLLYYNDLQILEIFYFILFYTAMNNGKCLDVHLLFLWHFISYDELSVLEII